MLFEKTIFNFQENSVFIYVQNLKTINNYARLADTHEYLVEKKNSKTTYLLFSIFEL